MADFAAALRTRLIALAGGQVFWTIVPAGKALPYIRLQTISDVRPEHLKGYDRARQTRVQADCFAATHKAAQALAAAAVAAVAAPATAGGVTFGRTKAEGPRDLGDDATESFIHRASVDLLVEHTGD